MRGPRYSRTIQLGYRVGEYTPVIPVGNLPPDAKLGDNRRVNRGRCPVACSLGPNICGLCKPRPDWWDSSTILHGARKRVLRVLPKPKIDLHALRAFVRSYVFKHYTPLPVDTDFSVEHWLEQTHYPLSRKNELLELWRGKQGRPLTKSDRAVACHIKQESYPEYKACRWIMSRSDYSKCIMGPISKAMEHELYLDDSFVKLVPVSERPRFIKDKLFSPGCLYVCTDYTAFESHFTDSVMCSIEGILYEHLLSNFPDKYKMYMSVITGENKMFFKKLGCFASCIARRMSGETNTSMGNGFSNLMISKFIADQHGCTVNMVVEGDDGLAVYSKGFVPTSKDFEDMGFTVKVNTTDSFSSASFCGLVADENELENVRDPFSKLLDFPWTNSCQYFDARPSVKRSLLKAKAMSVISELPSCPILTAWGVRYMTLLEKTEPLFVWDWWTSLNLDLKVKPRPIGYRTRELVAASFNVPISVQLEIEKRISTWTFDEINDPLVYEYCLKAVPCAEDVWNKYVSHIPSGQATSSILN